MKKREMKRLRKAYEEAIRQLAKGASVEEVAAGIYCDSVPGKTEENGRMMAEAIAAQVAQYYDNVAAASEDYDAWVSQMEDQLTAGLNQTAAYNQLYQVYIGAIAAGKINHACSAREKRAAKRWLEAARKRVFSDEEVTPEAMEQLHQDLAEALRETGMITTQLDAIQELLINAEADAGQVMNFAPANQDIMTILVMQTYVDVKNGRNKKFSADATLEEVTAAVCAAHDTCVIASQVQAGTITAEQGISLLGLITSAANGYLAYSFCQQSVSVLMGVLTLSNPIASAVVSVVAGVSMLAALAPSMMGNGYRMGRWVQNTATASVSAVYHGFCSLRNAYNRRATAVRTWIENVRTKLSQRHGIPEVQEETEDETDDEIEEETDFQTEAPTHETPVEAEYEMA